MPCRITPDADPFEIVVGRVGGVEDGGLMGPVQFKAAHACFEPDARELPFQHIKPIIRSDVCTRYKVLIAARDGEGGVLFSAFETVHRERPRHTARPFRDGVKRAVRASSELLSCRSEKAGCFGSTTVSVAPTG